jgi:hypothetical protein
LPACRSLASVTVVYWFGWLSVGWFSVRLGYIFTNSFAFFICIHTCISISDKRQIADDNDSATDTDSEDDDSKLAGKEEDNQF